MLKCEILIRANIPKNIQKREILHRSFNKQDDYIDMHTRDQKEDDRQQ